jgi:putative transposase
LCDRRFEWASLHGAVRPATGESFALVLPEVSTETMSLFLGQFAATLAPHAQALVGLDQAGWHGSRRRRVPENRTLMPLPPSSPELNPMEWVWLYPREHHLSHRRLDSYDAIVSACRTACNGLTADRFQSLGNHPWIARIRS